MESCISQSRKRCRLADGKSLRPPLQELPLNTLVAADVNWEEPGVLTQVPPGWSASPQKAAPGSCKSFQEGGSLSFEQDLLLEPEEKLLLNLGEELLEESDKDLAQEPSESLFKQPEGNWHPNPQVDLVQEPGKDILQEPEEDLYERPEAGLLEEVIEGLEALEEGLQCPVCSTDLTGLEVSAREQHTNTCLDQQGITKNVDHTEARDFDFGPISAPVIAWLEKLNLKRYAAAFVKEEVDFDSLKYLTEQDLVNMGLEALGPRRKIVNAIAALNNCQNSETDTRLVKTTSEDLKPSTLGAAKMSRGRVITDFFGGFSGKKQQHRLPDVSAARAKGRGSAGRGVPKAGRGGGRGASWRKAGGPTEAPPWVAVPGTDFRVDGFKYQTAACSHWFLTHFHSDHYQGLTRNFRHGTIYCSPITARLVHLKIGVPWDTLCIVEMDKQVMIAGVEVTFLEANHCPGAVMVLFKPPNGNPVLHTGDFRFCPAMLNYPALNSTNIHTLIIDTTYCDPQYEFPEQEAVVQYVIDAIQAEVFNPQTLFLIGTYTLGKERLFLEIARALNCGIYVGAARQRMLACLELPAEDLQKMTTNELEAHVHVVPLWSIANFKRLQSVAKHYKGRYNTIVAFSPTGWSLGRSQKRTNGTRRQQGTLVRYEVPYSEHSSFSEMRKFVEFLKPEVIIPSVNNDQGAKREEMLQSLLQPSGSR